MIPWLIMYAVGTGLLLVGVQAIRAVPRRTGRGVIYLVLALIAFMAANIAKDVLR